ncbi:MULTISPECIES: hypothetical protein [Moorena]|uniref:hypothetical protein n=1 Tax=Moorena TaxID=1155738 RepID=UPI0012B5380F|nr:MULTISPECIES: hypothetical protein [Moorena]NEP32232.1 hypothetical protein [Moorena sp. SIO3B2]NEQ07714.1 hypothetical protein [Moorena sp. SIO4E2]NES46861.1 hypothetical protein [Moorena sp. SIO2C4]
MRYTLFFPSSLFRLPISAAPVLMQSLMGETTPVAHGLFAKRRLRRSYRKTVEP